MVSAPQSEQTASHSGSGYGFAKEPVGPKVKQRKASVPAHECDMFQNIVEPTANMNTFLTEFAPTASNEPSKCPDRKFNAKINTGEGREREICKNLVSYARGMHDCT